MRATHPSTTPCTRDLQRGVEAAATAYRQIAEDFATHLLDRAPEADAAGRERYSLASRQFLGTTIDLEETYAWGQEELARITAEMEATAQRILPGAGVREAIEHLDRDPAYLLHGTDALRGWMQERADEVIADMAGRHFDIPEPVRVIEGRIAPTHTGGIYYTGPSDDFTRPGRMWWSVPKGVTEFSTWRELTTVYHEGVPGHHLQVAQTVYRRELLNRWRRMMCWVSGHGEGWALYAERLMAELGYMDDPGNYLGLLDGQSLRAARVVHRHRRALRLRGARRGRRRRVDLRQGLDLPHGARQPGREHDALRAQPLPRLARAGAELQDRRAALAAAA